MKDNRGFTLIELLVVVAIIGLLSSIILAAVGSARTKAQYAQSNEEMHQIINSVVIAQQTSGLVLMQITGTGWTIGTYGCADGVSKRNVGTSDTCYQGWVNAVTKIQAAEGSGTTGITNILRDPWGSPFSLDENEHEINSTDCRPNYLYSAGPDGIFGNSDDIIDIIPPLYCPG